MSLEFWRNVSIIWISLQLLILCLIPLAVTFLAVRGMGWVLHKTPVGLHQLQNVTSMVRERTETTTEKIAGPVIGAQAQTARLQGVFRGLLRRDHWRET